MVDVYHIGVSIALSNGVSPVLGVIARDLLGVHANVNKLEGGFSRLKLAIGGVVAVAAGAAIIGGVVALAKAGEELSRQQASMASAGISNHDIAMATARAWSMSADIMGTRVADNLKAIAHLRASFGDLGEAIGMAPQYQRNSVALGRITGRDGEGEAFKIAQAIHLSGAANDPVTKRLREDRFGQQMNLYTAMVAAGGGKISAGDLLSFQKQAGSYGGNLTNEGRIDVIGLIQAMGGQKAGTMLSTANRALKDGTLQRPALFALEGMGLIDPKLVSVGRGGGSGGASAGGGIQMKPGALTNELEFRQDPMRWVWDTLVPKLRAGGINSTEDQINWVQHAKLTSNVTRLLAEGIRNQGVDQQEAKNVRVASGANQYQAIMSRDLGANVVAFKDSWHNLLTALGSPLIKPAISALQNVTHAVQAVTRWAVANPKTVVLVAQAAVVLGAALVGFGLAAVGIAAFAAIAAGGVVGVAIAATAAIIGAVTAFVVFNWDAVAGVFNKIKTVVMGFFNWLVHGDGQIKPGGYGAALTTAMNAPSPAKKPFQAPPLRPEAPFRWGNVYMDHKKVGQIIGEHLANMAGSAHQGTASHDPTMSPAPVGFGYPAGF